MNHASSVSRVFFVLGLSENTDRKCSGTRPLHASAPTLWNRLLDTLRDVKDTPLFVSSLKWNLFSAPSPVSFADTPENADGEFVGKYTTPEGLTVSVTTGR